MKGSNIKKKKKYCQFLKWYFVRYSLGPFLFNLFYVRILDYWNWTWFPFLYFWNGSHAIPMKRPFFTKISYHRNVSLAVYLPIFYFSFCQKTNLHLYEQARLSSLLFTFFRRFSIKMYVLCYCVEAAKRREEIKECLTTVKQVFFLY